MIAAKAADMAAPAFSRPCLVRAVASSSIDWNVTGAGGVLNSEANIHSTALKKAKPAPIHCHMPTVSQLTCNMLSRSILFVRATHNNHKVRVRQRPCSALASSHGARIHTSRSSSVVKITGMSFWWIGSTTALCAVVRKPYTEVGGQSSERIAAFHFEPL